MARPQRLSLQISVVVLNVDVDDNVDTDKDGDGIVKLGNFYSSFVLTFLMENQTKYFSFVPQDPAQDCV